MYCVKVLNKLFFFWNNIIGYYNAHFYGINYTLYLLIIIKYSSHPCNVHYTCIPDFYNIQCTL